MGTTTSELTMTKSKLRTNMFEVKLNASSSKLSTVYSTFNFGQGHEFRIMKALMSLGLSIQKQPVKPESHLSSTPFFQKSKRQL